MSQSYDIIGDVHGRAEALETLLDEMGYELVDGIYTHPEGRKVVFLGDFIDKGPEQKRALGIVRAMVDSGNALAVMGNHEFNAICYATQMEDGHYIRPHSNKNNKQHELFLKEFPLGSPEHGDAIAWFKTLPVYKDLEEFRVVHACWDDEAIGVLQQYLNDDHTIPDESYELFDREEQPFYDAIENVLKGPVLVLPNDITFTDSMGHERDEGRIFWWSSPEAPMSESVGLLGKEMDDDIAAAINESGKLRLDFMKSAKPTFVGHYYLEGPARHLSAEVTGLDYRNQVTGYRWHGGDNNATNEFVVSPSFPY